MTGGRDTVHLPIRFGQRPSVSSSAGSAYAVAIEAAEFRELTDAFDRRFPEFADFTDVKKLDFMVWQSREPEA